MSFLRGSRNSVSLIFLTVLDYNCLFHQLEGYCQILGEFFTPMLFIYGPKYSRSKMQVHVLLILYLGKENWLFGCHVKEITWFGIN